MVSQGLKRQMESVAVSPHEVGELRAPIVAPVNTMTSGGGTDAVEVQQAIGESPDVVVLMMGVTGAGKSTFVSLLAEPGQNVQVGHDLQSSTTQPGLYSLQYDERTTVFLVDTPGFNDTTRSDVDILKEIAFFLASVYKSKARLAGIVYLHRISDQRFTGSAKKNVEVLQRLCGPQNLQQVSIVTNMWPTNESNPEAFSVAVKRESDLQKPTFFGSLLQHGSRMTRHDGTARSAHHIITSLIESGQSVVLDIQRQLVDEGRPLLQTSAGQYLDAEFGDARKAFEREMADLQENMEEAKRDQDREAMEAIESEKKAAEEKLALQIREREDLQMTLEQLAEEQTGRYQNYALRIAAQDPSSGASAQSDGVPGRPAPGHRTKSDMGAEQARIRQLERSLADADLRYRQEVARMRLDQQSQANASYQAQLMADENQKRLQMEMAMLRRDLQRQKTIAKQAEARNPFAEVQRFAKQLFGFGGGTQPRRSDGWAESRGNRDQRHHQSSSRRRGRDPYDGYYGDMAY